MSLLVWNELSESEKFEFFKKRQEELTKLNEEMKREQELHMEQYVESDIDTLETLRNIKKSESEKFEFFKKRQEELTKLNEEMKREQELHMEQYVKIDIDTLETLRNVKKILNERYGKK